MASDCVPRWRQEAAYLRFIHGFVQSAPQLVLQSVIFLKGIHIHSLHHSMEAVQLALKDEEKGSVIEALVALTNDKPLRWYWGLIQVFSLLMSFISVLQTMIQFNEWDKRRHTLHRLLLVVPFFASAIIYRVLALALILCFAGGQLGMLPIIGLLFTQVRHFAIIVLSRARLCISAFRPWP